MKCPKCGYLGFEPADRCRNCQYDFSLASTHQDLDFSIFRESETVNPLEDLSLIDAASTWQPGQKGSGAGADLDRIFGAPDPQPDGAEAASNPAASPAAVSRIAPAQELPLFGPPIPDDEPLITKASPPRQPLAVRRGTPEVHKPRVEPQFRTPNLDLGLEVVDPSPTPVVLPADRFSDEHWDDEHEIKDAGVGARLLAVIVDLLILTVVDSIVIYFTM